MKTIKDLTPKEILDSFDAQNLIDIEMNHLQDIVNRKVKGGKNDKERRRI